MPIFHHSRMLVGREKQSLGSLHLELPTVRNLILAAGLVLAMSAAAFAQSNSQEAAFVNQAASGNRAEIALGDLIVKNSSNPTALSFARRMIADHGANLTKVEALARQLGISIAPKLPTDAREEMAKLNALSGDALAHAYLAGAVTDHENDIAQFQKAEHEFSNSAVKGYIAATLPVMREHLSLAQTDVGKVPQ